MLQIAQKIMAHGPAEQSAHISVFILFPRVWIEMTLEKQVKIVWKAQKAESIFWNHKKI